MGAVKKGVIPRNFPLLKKCTRVITPHFWGAGWLKRQKAPKSVRKASKSAKKRQKSAKKAPEKCQKT